MATQPVAPVAPVAPAAPTFASGPGTCVPASVAGVGGAEPVPAGYVRFDPDRSGVPLLPAHVVRIVWIVGQVLSVPLVVFGVGAAVNAVVTALALPVWSALIGINIRRAKPATQHATAPRPAWLALSWFAPVAVILGLVAALVVLGRFGDGGSSRVGPDELSIRDLSIVVVVVGIVVVLFSLFVPYAAHGRAARWVGGDPSSFTRWFWGPIVSALFASVAFAMVSRTVVAGGGEVSYVVAALAIATLAVPSVVYVVMGNRALRGLEEATEAAATRRTLDGRLPTGITAAQVAAITGQAARP